MTTNSLVTLHDVRVLRCAPDGPLLDSESAAQHAYVMEGHE